MMMSPILSTVEDCSLSPYSLCPLCFLSILDYRFLFATIYLLVSSLVGSYQ